MSDGGAFEDFFKVDETDTWPDPVPHGPDLPPVPALDRKQVEVTESTRMVVNVRPVRN